MATFQVPQFIEEKAKIVGFLTLQQFLMIAGAAGIGILLYYVLSFFLWFLVSSLLVGTAIAFSFVKINGQDLPKIALAALRYIWQPRRFTWQRAMEETSVDTSEIERLSTLRRSMSIQEKLKSIAESVTTGKIFGAKEMKRDSKGQKYETVTFLTGEKRNAKRVDY